MGKSSSSKTEVTDYRLSVHFGVCQGPVDYVRALRVNEKDVWRGTVGDVLAMNVDQPYLFGGPQKEGGVKGTIHVLPGRGNQLLPGALAARIGKPPEQCVAYRGITSIYLTGQTVGEGWTWGTSPVVATQVEVEVTRMAKGLNPAWATIPNPDHPDKPDTNPAHIIYEAVTDPVDGSMRPEDVNIAGFNRVAQQLYNEQFDDDAAWKGFGLSLGWFKSMKVEDFVSEIQDHINAVTFVDPETGLFDIALVRDDYDPAELFEINASNATLVSFERRMFGEIVNQINLDWTDPNTEKTVTVTVQDLATAQFQGLVVDSRNHYGIRHKALAEAVAWRDLRTANAPLAAVEVDCDRSAWNLRPGQPVRVYFPDENPDKTVDLICRLGDIEYGEPDAESIPISMMEDVFSLERPTQTRATDSEWLDTAEAPSPMHAQAAFTLPLFIASSPAFNEAIQPLDYPEVIAGVLGHHPSYDAVDFELFDAEVQPTGGLEVTTAGRKTITGRGTVQHSIPVEASSSLLLSFANVTRGPRVGGFLLVGDTETTQEIMLVRAFDGFQWTVSRGVLDTVPRAWPANTPMWFVNPNSRIVDDRTIRSDGEIVNYKMLPRTSLGQLSLDAATQVTATLTGRPHYPLRPGNVKINGVPAQGSVAAGAEIAVTWATRNRLLEDGQVVRWDAGAVAPEYRQRTIVLVTDMAGNEIIRYRHLWTEQSWVMPAAWFARWAAVKVYVYAERDELTSLQVYGYTVTGLANNPAALPPPPAPEPGVPPAPIPSPGGGVFSANGGFITTEVTSDGRNLLDGALPEPVEGEEATDPPPTVRIPALAVDGFAAARIQDYREAQALQVRFRAYRVGVDGDGLPVLGLGVDEDGAAIPGDGFRAWVYETHELNDYDTHIRITNVAPVTRYEVEVAYISPEGITSGFTGLGSFTTSELIANEAVSFGGLTAAEVRAALLVLSELGDALGADVAGRIQEILDRLDLLDGGGEGGEGVDIGAMLRDIFAQLDFFGEDGENLARSILRLAREQTDLRRMLDSLTYIGGVPVGTVIYNETVARTEGDTLIIERTDQISVRVDDAQAAIIYEAGVRANADSAEAYSRNQLGVRVGNSEAAIITEQNARATADSAEANLRTILAARVTGAEAAIITEQQVRASADSAEATARTTLAVRVTGAEAAIVTEQQVRATADSAEATARTTLAARVTGAEAAIVTEQQVRASADSAEATARTTLAVQVGNNSAAIVNEQTARANADSAEASARQILAVQVGNNSAAIVTEQTARVNADNAEATARQLLGVRVGDNEAAISNEATVRANADSAEATLRQALAVRVGNSESAITNEATVRANADSAEATIRQALAVRVEDAYGAIANEATVRANADSAEATLRQALDVRVGSAEAAITNEQSVRANADSVEASARTILAGRVTGAEVAIANEASIRANADGIMATTLSLMGGRRGDQSGFILNENIVDIGSRGTMATVINGLIATDGGNTAAISAEQSARISAVGIVAQSVTNLSTTVGGNSSSITQLFSSTNGLAARYALVLNVNGLITGVEANGAIGSYIVAAQYFGIAAVTGGTSYFPFTIDAAQGKIALTGSVTINGTLLVTGTVTTPTLANNSITLIDSATSGGSLYGSVAFDWQTAVSYNISLPYAAKLVLQATGSQSYSGSPPIAWEMRIMVNGVAYVAGAGGAGFGTDSVALSGHIDVGAGVFNVAVQWRGDSTYIRLAQANLVSMAVFK